MADGAFPPEVKNAIDGFAKTLHDIREEQKRIDAEVKKKGDADPLLKASLERLEKSHEKITDDINALHRKANRQVILDTPESKRAAEHERKANLEIQDWFKEKGIACPVNETEAGLFRKNYAAASSKMIRRGEKALTPDEQKALSVGSAPDNGFWIEPMRSDMIITRMRETSPMRDIAQVITISGPSIKFPVDRDDVTGEWVSEQGTRNDTTTPQTGELEIPVHEMSAMPKATQNLLDDATFDVESWLNGKIGDKFARMENTAFVTGTGVAKPAGFLSQAQGTFVTTADATRTFGALQYIATGVSGGFAVASASVSQADKLLDLIFSFNAAYRASLRWTMNKTTLAQVRKFKDQQGNYIYDYKLGANGIIDSVLGYPVTEFSDMADYSTANAFAIALGDFKRGYLVVDRQGIRQLRDPFTSKPYVKFYTTKRVGGAIIDSDAIKVLKFGTS